MNSFLLVENTCFFFCLFQVSVTLVSPFCPAICATGTCKLITYRVLHKIFANRLCLKVLANYNVEVGVNLLK